MINLSLWITTVLLTIADTVLMVLNIRRTLRILKEKHPEWELDVLPPDGIFFWTKFGLVTLVPVVNLLVNMVLVLFSNELCNMAAKRIENRIELELIAEQYRNAKGKVLKVTESSGNKEDK